MKKVAKADIAIFGGGIAGLWLLHQARQAGFSAFLFDTGPLGGGQTHKAQGIIHGGMKYALQGVLTNEAKLMADLPNRWLQCLQGNGEIDLSAVPVLSTKHYLWSTNKLTGKLTGFLAGAALTSKVTPVAKENCPQVFQDNAFRGQVFALDELVLDVPALVRELVRENQDVIYKIENLSTADFSFHQNGELEAVTISMGETKLAVAAKQFVFTAGIGNAIAIEQIKSDQVAMQRRPLHMVLVKTPFQYPLYAHCLGLGPRPRITVTTHYMQDGGCVWYLGGAIAEDGVKLSSEKQIEAAKAELASLFPWLNFAEAEFATFMIDRAEPRQKSGLKPESVYVKAIQNMMIAWPTKLALAPTLSDEIIKILKTAVPTPGEFDARELMSWPMPSIAKPVWEEAFCKNVP